MGVHDRQTSKLLLIQKQTTKDGLYLSKFRLMLYD
ncbi:hypothetical protein Taro_011717 [Colocasia esculenta]|uniref:Uncharacterized protein n=1 Tax=Colocasia esculenta TaxID=4460 RepID=A0A843UBF9_COLES|nr:hypothetical protein [Colocasia esculenta]